jgi:APA family basic amino acid/polyamine antiporter
VITSPLRSPPSTPIAKRKLKKVLGLSFGLAVMVGGIIGVGILRNPGVVAGILPNKWLIIFAWFFGGIYVLMALGSLAELAAMLPKAGGTFNYVKRAYGDYPGFIIGWFDYINNAIAPGYFSIVIAEYLVLLFPQIHGHETVLALSALIAFTLLNLTGVKTGSLTQQVTSFIKVLAFLALVVCCFIIGGDDKRSEEIPSGLSITAINDGLILAFIKGLQFALGT